MRSGSCEKSGQGWTLSDAAGSGQSSARARAAKRRSWMIDQQKALHLEGFLFIPIAASIDHVELVIADRCDGVLGPCRSEAQPDEVVGVRYDQLAVRSRFGPDRDGLPRDLPRLVPCHRVVEREVLRSGGQRELVGGGHHVADGISV